MPRRRFALLLWLISDVASPMNSVTQTRPDLSRLQSILNKKAVQWNTSFSIGVFSESLGSFGAAGYICSDRFAGLRQRLPRGALPRDAHCRSLVVALMQWVERPSRSHTDDQGASFPSGLRYQALYLRRGHAAVRTRQAGH